VEERERRLLRGKQNEIERKGGGARGARQGQDGLGRGPDRRPGRKPIAHTTTNQNLIANEKPKTRQDGRAIKHNIRQKKYASTRCNTHVNLGFCLHARRTPVTILEQNGKRKENNT
jgi:hypothetical protein